MATEWDVSGFVRWKVNLLDQETAWSRAMCAKLRGATGKHPSETPEVWELTFLDAPEEWFSRNGIPSREENAIHVSLTLYALHRQGKNRSMSVSGRTDEGKEMGDSFGAATGKLVAPDRGNVDAIKRRFDSVATASEFYELAYHARSIIKLLKAGDLVMDYPRFAADLVSFQLPSRSGAVKLRWGEDFYRVLSRHEIGKDEEV